MDRTELKELARSSKILTNEDLSKMSRNDLYWYGIYKERWLKQQAKEQLNPCELPVMKFHEEDGTMDVKIKGTDRYWHVTKHAIKRFNERTDALSHKNPNKYLANDLYGSRPATTADAKAKVLALLNHHLEEAEYRFGKHTGILYVIVDGRVKTCHKNEAKRYIMK